MGIHAVSIQIRCTPIATLFVVLVGQAIEFHSKDHFDSLYVLSSMLINAALTQYELISVRKQLISPNSETIRV